MDNNPQKTNNSTATTASVASSSLRHKENHRIASDILDDLSSRFIINVPVEERSDFIRICFQIELAHWFYLDFYCSAEDTRLVPCGIKQFAFHIFHHIPFLKEHLHRLNDIMTEFKLYKMSVPTYGAILMTSDRQRVLLVQSYFAKSSWGFPKGKVNEDEEPLHCAIREVYEETGFDITPLIRADAFIEGVLNYQYTRLYIVPNVPADTVFVPRTRMEIRSCTWFKLDLLPTHKMDPVCKEKLGINANSFFMIMPFVKRLKRWVQDQNNGVLHVSNQNGRTSASAASASTSKRNGGVVVVGGGDPRQQQQPPTPLQQLQQQQRRQRHKSLGDLDSIPPAQTANNPASGTAKPQPIQQQQPLAKAAQQRQQPPPPPTTQAQALKATGPIQTLAAVTVVPMAPDVSSSTNQSSSQQRNPAEAKNGTQPTAATATKPGNFKRQLFTLQQQQHQSSAAQSHPPPRQQPQLNNHQHHSNPLAVAQQASVPVNDPHKSYFESLHQQTAKYNAANAVPRQQRHRHTMAAFLNVGAQHEDALVRWHRFRFIMRPNLFAC